MPLERSTANGTSLLGKFTAYREIIARRVHRAFWGVPNLLVLTVSVNERHLSNAVRRMEGSGPETAAFLFKKIDPRASIEPMPAILDAPWLRAGHPSMTIAHPGRA